MTLSVVWNVFDNMDHKNKTKFYVIIMINMFLVYDIYKYIIHYVNDPVHYTCYFAEHKDFPSVMSGKIISQVKMEKLRVLASMIKSSFYDRDWRIKNVWRKTDFSHEICLKL